MRILALPSSYPFPGHSFSGIFNERCVSALSKLCEGVEVLAPRPFVPPLLSFMPRWKAYSTIKRYEIRNGVSIYRPAIPVIPRIGGAFWVDQGTFLLCRRLARSMHLRTPFDAIISFGLVETGGVAWRLSRDLGIPASGWAFGNDVRFPRSSPFARVAARAIERLDIVFYQSHELLEIAAGLLGISPDRMSRKRHVVLPHGIPDPPSLPRGDIRDRVRQEWRVRDDQVVILSTGRIFREKGAFELMEAVSLASAQDPSIVCLLVGSIPAFDETAAVQKKLEQTPGLRERVKLLPACSPDKVWEHLCGADIFALTSHNEGMPNSLLEAMAMGVPAIAFGIPPVLEIEAGTGGLVLVPPFDCSQFAEAILRLAASPDGRARIGEKGRARIMDHYMVKKNMAAALKRLAQVKATLNGEPFAETRSDSFGRCG